MNCSWNKSTRSTWRYWLSCRLHLWAQNLTKVTKISTCTCAQLLHTSGILKRKTCVSVQCSILRSKNVQIRLEIRAIICKCLKDSGLKWRTNTATGTRTRNPTASWTPRTSLILTWRRISTKKNLFTSCLHSLFSNRSLKASTSSQWESSKKYSSWIPNS